MKIVSILKELLATLSDALECADFPGHLRSWWKDATTGVGPESQAQEAL